MSPRTEEWIRKAEADFGTAVRELAVVEQTNYDAVCFHAQQCVEKYLKAALVTLGRPVPKIHDLSGLLDSVAHEYQVFVRFEGRLDDLTSSAVTVRYPGLFADQDEAHEALETAREFRIVARQAMGLE